MIHPSPTRHQQHRHFDDGQGHAWCECLSLEGVYRTDDGGEMIYRLWRGVVLYCDFWCPVMKIQGVLQDSKLFLFKFVESLDPFTGNQKVLISFFPFQ